MNDDNIDTEGSDLEAELAALTAEVEPSPEALDDTPDEVAAEPVVEPSGDPEPDLYKTIIKGGREVRVRRYL